MNVLLTGIPIFHFISRENLFDLGIPSLVISLFIFMKFVLGQAVAVHEK